MAIAIARIARWPVCFADAGTHSFRRSALTTDARIGYGCELYARSELEAWPDGAPAGLQIRDDWRQEKAEMVTPDFDPEAGARISAALIKALAEAQVLADAGDIGLEFRDIVQHARELYVLLLEQLITAGPMLGEEAQGMGTAMGNRLFELVALAEERPPVADLN